eukprot:CAMPEP_0196822254 /NCGR_PEP_ID=MMETSP1362-20130617/82753_1 /TAXON_ID=163516 /ORGANISM="Leptocylindrus danicus, Strain CCMP1856" /LENGTH=1200 /DNA_ID=CAMNT_0042201759 /DNA_START=62 /DNA_END=3664 /DNA_ORIENTATION=+
MFHHVDIPRHILTFLENASKSKQYDVWTEQFVQFDGDLLADYSACVQSEFDVQRLVLSPLSFLNKESKRSNNAYDVALVGSFFKSNDAVQNAVLDANASWMLTTAQSRLIRSWRRFMDVCVLRSHRSSGVVDGAGNKNDNLAVNTQGDNDENVVPPIFPTTPKDPKHDGGISPSPLLMGRKRSSSGGDYDNNNNSNNSAIPITPKVLRQPPKGSSFVGDNRSYSMIRHFVQALVSHGHNIHEVSTHGSYASAKVAVELSEALVSMLHHQLKDVVIKALDPTSAVTEPRKETRLGAAECTELLVVLQSTCLRLFTATRPVDPGVGLVAGGTTVLDDDQQQQSERNVGADAARRKEYMLGCRLRLHLFTAALLLLQAREDAEETFQISSPKDANMHLRSAVSAVPTSPDHYRTWNEARLGFADLACDTLQLLNYTPEGWAAAASYGYPYTFNVSQGKQVSGRRSASLLPLHLLRMSWKLLKSLLPGISGSGNGGYAYSADLSGAFLRGNLQAAMWKHMEAASHVAAAILNADDGISSGSDTPIATKERDASSMKHQRTPRKCALEVITGTMEFISSAALSPDLTAFLTRDGYMFRLLANNKLLREAGLKWEQLSEDELSRSMRGYAHCTQTQEASTSVGTVASAVTLSSSRIALGKGIPRSSAQLMDDPVHKIWILALRSVSNFLRTSKSFTPSSMVNPCLNDAIGFLRAFELVIVSAILIPRKMKSLKVTKNAAPFQFTVNGLSETAECLSLLKELCSRPNLRHFTSTAPELSSRLLNTALSSMRSLSAFLHSTTIARELFTGVSKLQAAESSNHAGGVYDGPSIQEILMIPNFQSGPSAKHEAIKHAQFANTATLPMSEVEHALFKSVSGAKINVGSNVNVSRGIEQPKSPTDISQSIEIFLNSVDNDLVKKMEHFAAQGVLHALTIIARAHPASSSWIFFDAEEAAGMNIASLVREGAVIAVRTSPGHIIENSFECAKVLSCKNGGACTELSVQYMHSGSMDSINASRIAGIQDSDARSNIFKFTPAPKSASDAVNADANLGHLIVLLRWCKRSGQHSNTAVSRALVNCLTERSANLLALELSLHKEARTASTSAEDATLLNCQLFELFDESTDADLSRITDSTPLKTIMSADGWLNIVAQIQYLLDKARADRVVTQEKQMRSPRASWSRRRRTNINRDLKSPTFTGLHIQTPIFSPKD